MQTLINELVEKAGLSTDQAVKAVETTMHFIKSKLPEGFSDKVEGLMNGSFDLGGMFGSSTSGAETNSPLDALKGMFGTK